MVWPCLALKTAFVRDKLAHSFSWLKMCNNSTIFLCVLCVNTQKLTLACIQYAHAWRAYKTEFLRAYDIYFVGVHMIRTYPTTINLTIAYHMHPKVNFCVSTPNRNRKSCHWNTLSWSRVSFSGSFAGRILEASWRRCHSSSGFSLSQFVLFLHVIPDRLMMIRSDLCVENLTGLLQLMAKWMFGNVNWYFLLTHYSKR